MSVAPEHNRFPRAWPGLTAGVRSRLRRVAMGVALVLLAIEALGVGLATYAQVSRGIPLDVLLRHYLLTRVTVSWWWPGETVAKLERATGAPYLGFRRDGASSLLVADAVLGFRMRPRALTLHRNELAPGYYWVATDQFGFVLNSHAPSRPAPEKPADEFRVIVLGGSTLMGDGAASVESIPAFLERQMAGRPGKRVRVINAGVAGYFSAQELLYLVTELLAWNPDLVIVYDGWNDQIASAYPLVSRAGGPALSGRLSRHEALSAHLEGSTTIVGALANLGLAVGLKGSRVWHRTGLQEASAWAARAGHDLRERAKAVIDSHPTLRAAFAAIGLQRQPSFRIPYHPEVTAAYRSNLNAIATMARAHGISVAMFLQPIMGIDDKTYVLGERGYTTSKALLEWRRSFYADARRNLAELRTAWRVDRGVCVADLSRVFSGRDEPLYTDTGHLNSLGNSIVAAEILRHLDDCAVVPAAVTR